MKVEKYYKLCMRLCREHGGLEDDGKCKSCPLQNLHCGYFFDDLEYSAIKENIKKVKGVLKAVYPQEFKRRYYGK